MLSRMPTDLLICVATELEGALLRERLGGLQGRIGGRGVELVVSGIGLVNAAHAVARRDAAELVVCGVGGAYPDSGLAVGDVACAETEHYADLGIEGSYDMEAAGFTVVAGHYNRMPLSVFPAARRVPFVTSSTCTATDARAREIVVRTGGAVESMEGAAVVHVALLEGKPVGEIRGICNPVGERDRGAWRVREAAEAAQRVLIEWLEW